MLFARAAPVINAIGMPARYGRIVAVRLLSVQSEVAYGHVGNSAAVFPLQRLGVEVVAVPTVLFSNHTGYGSWRGLRLAPEQVADVLLGVEERGAFADLDVVLSGYLGDAGTALVVADAVRRVKAASPGAVYACDPVMGNAAAGLFVAPAIPELLRAEVVPLADLITPNAFELGLLTGTEPTTLPELLDAADLARALGPSTVLVTSVARAEGDPETVEMLAVDAAGAWLVGTPRLPRSFGGTGDVTAALFTAHLRTSGDAAGALARTASSVFDLIELTVRAGDGELRIVDAQERYGRPRLQFAVRRVR
ncbi:pyridoxal kinase [Amnibacterium kyonggiense]